MAYQGRQPGVGVRNRFIYSATGGQTSFSGADSNGLTLAYADATYVDVFLNGTLLVPVTDYAATTKTSVVLGSGAAASDIVEIVAYDISSMSGAVNKTGGSMTGDLSFGDNDKAIFGAGSDLQIYHSGSHSVIKDAGDGNLQLIANDFQLRNGADNANMMTGANGGAVTLMHNGSSKLATTSTGIDVTGTVTSDGLTVDGSSTFDDIKLTPVALPSSGNPSIALRNTDNNIYIQTGSGNALSLLDSSQDTMYIASSTSHSFNISNSEKMRIHASGAVTMPSQPAFMVNPQSTQENISPNGIRVITWDVERFDQGGNFSSNSFTAPITGKYQLNVELRLDNVDTAATYCHLYLVTSNKTYHNIIQPRFTSDPAYWSLSASVLADMDANDTAYVGLYLANGATQTDVNNDSNFSGYLVA